MPPSEEVKKTIGRALGRIPSGVFILTAKHQSRQIAMMASWVQQVAFEPPAISVAISRERPAGPIIKDSNRFALSVLADGDSTLMKRYARAAGIDAEAFSGVSTSNSPGGIPILADALAWLECELIQIAEFNADHDLYIARVTQGELLREGHSFTHVRGNGFHY